MKKIFFMLMISGCSKTSYQEIPAMKSPTLAPSVWSLSGAPNYSPNIDLLVAFLWPEKISTSQQKKDLKTIFLLSKKIKSQKEKFQMIRYQLRQEYQRFDCPCILEFRCQGNETYEDEARCLKIENNIFENDKKLPEIFDLVKLMKQKVLSLGGEWILSNQDFPDAPISTFNRETLTLNLTVFGSINERPLAYQMTCSEHFQDGDFQQLTFTHARLDRLGYWKIVVSPFKRPASQLFQGELYWIHQNKKRYGFIFWEHSL